MTKITLNDLSTISGNEQSAINLINANNATIETASDNTLSRDGTSPNQMLSSLDMNSFRILNLPDAINFNEPLTYSQFLSLSNGSLPPTYQWARISAPYTLTSQTAAQKIFNVSTNGAVSVSDLTGYEFECQFNLSSMSASSGNFGFQFGGTAVLTSLKWSSIANKTATLDASGAAFYGQRSNTIQIANLVTSNTTGTEGFATIKGLIMVTTGGTLIPQVILGVAAPAVVGANSFFKIWSIGTNTQTTQGTWS